MPQEDWRENFKVKIRKNAKPGKNSLHFGYYADGVEPSGLNIEIKIDGLNGSILEKDKGWYFS